MEDVYERLRRKLDEWPIGFPKSEEALEILRVLYTPEEAELALKLPFVTQTLEEIAAQLKEDPDRLRKKLDRMADKGTVFAVEREGKKFYRLLPSIVGFSETPF